jgi:hypothetical protein
MSLGIATRGYASDQTGGGGAAGPVASILGVGINYIDVAWTMAATLTVVGVVPSNWVVTPVIGRAVTVLSVTQLNPTTTRLTTSDQTSGGSYFLAVPAAAVIDTGLVGNPNAFTSLSFIGVGHLPSLVSANPLTPNTVEATFSEAVVAVEALAFSNYSFDNGLSAVSVAQVSSTIFIVTTSEMTPATIYTLTVSGIHDLAGNPVT